LPADPVSSRSPVDIPPDDAHAVIDLPEWLERSVELSDQSRPLGVGRFDSKARKRHADAGIGERRDEPTQAIRQKPVVTVEELDQLALGLPDAAVMIRDGTNVYSVSQRANPGIVESHHMIERRVCGCVIDNEAFEIGISLLKRTR
jgi:hypothetical protein